MQNKRCSHPQKAAALNKSWIMTPVTGTFKNILEKFMASFDASISGQNGPKPFCFKHVTYPLCSRGI